jgi:hypothetical protein
MKISRRNCQNTTGFKMMSEAVTGRKNRDTLLTENIRFMGMKEVCLMDPGNPEDRDRIRIFRNEAGRFCDLPEIFVKNGSCHAC